MIGLPTTRSAATRHAADDTATTETASSTLGSPSGNGVARGELGRAERGRAALGRGGQSLLAPVGRVALWTFVALVLVRGLGAILGGAPTLEGGSAAAARGVGFPDVEARAFAVRFARAYLSFDPKRPEAYRRAVAAYLPDDLSDQAAALLPSRGPGARIAWATVAREASLGSSRALITVATASTAGSVRYLSVPITRDRTDGLVVFDLPSLSAPPAKGSVEAPDPVALSGPDARPIEDLAKRFLTVYLAGGDRAALAYFLAPGTRLVRMPDDLDVVEVDQVARDPRPVRRGLAVSALVRVRDRASGATLKLRYRLSVVRRERWYIRAVAGGPSA